MTLVICEQCRRWAFVETLARGFQDIGAGDVFFVDDRDDSVCCRHCFEYGHNCHYDVRSFTQEEAHDAAQ